MVDTLGQITKKPWWPLLKARLVQHGWRFEIRGIPESGLQGLKAPCATCGRWVPVVRESGRWYLALTCPLREHVGCARTGKAKAVAADLRKILEWEAI